MLNYFTFIKIVSILLSFSNNGLSIIVTFKIGCDGPCESLLTEREIIVERPRSTNEKYNFNDYYWITSFKEIQIVNYNFRGEMFIYGSISFDNIFISTNDTSFWKVRKGTEPCKNIAIDYTKKSSNFFIKLNVLNPSNLVDDSQCTFVYQMHLCQNNIFIFGYNNSPQTIFFKSDFINRSHRS